MSEETFDSGKKAILEKLGDKSVFYGKENMDLISEREKYAERLWHAYVEIEFLEHKFQDKKDEIKKECLELLQRYYEENQIIGDLILVLKPDSEKQSLHFQELAAQKFIIASQKSFEFLQESGIESDCLIEEDEGIKTFVSTQSRYHHASLLLKKAEGIFEDIAVYHSSKNNYQKVHLYYFLLGELLIKEISYAEKINDWVMYGDLEIGHLYYNAGLAFMKCYKSLKDKYILCDYGSPVASYIDSAISDVFSLGNIGLRPEQLAVRCFEKSKPFLLKSGEKVIHSKVVDYLYELKSELNDFEENVVQLLVKISREFQNRENIVLRKTVGNILEGDVRDYFLSIINVVINEIAVAENTKKKGFSDMTIFGKDNFGNILEAVAEFKVWPRNDYKDVITQIKSYLTLFENFGIIIMVNEGKSSISKRYKEEIIDKDSLMVDGSFEIIRHGETGFEYFKTKSFVDDSKIKNIPIYHLILDVGNLLKGE